jgi:hypothetical protein
VRRVFIYYLFYFILFYFFLMEVQNPDFSFHRKGDEPNFAHITGEKKDESEECYLMEVDSFPALPGLLGSLSFSSSVNSVFYYLFRE